MQGEIQTFLEHLAVDRSCSTNTISAYRNDLVQFQGYLASLPTAPTSSPGWSNLAEETVTAYLDFLHRQDYASSTLARKIAAVRGFLSHLQETGHLSSDIKRLMRPPRVEKSLPTTIAPATIQRLLAESTRERSPRSLRDKALLEVLCATGMRVSEVVNLNVEDVDPSAHTVTCGERSIRRRVVTVSAAVADALQRYLDHGRAALLKRDGEAALFLNQRGQRLTRQGLWLIIREYAATVGLTEDAITPHALRHSFAAHLLDNGAAPADVQKRMGNLSVGSVKGYRQSAQPSSGIVLDGIRIEPVPADSPPDFNQSGHP